MDYNRAVMFSEKNVDKFLEVYHHFNNRYGKKQAEFILSRLYTAFTYSKKQLIDAGEKMAVINKWKTKDTI